MTDRLKDACARYAEAKDELVSAMRHELALKDPPAHVTYDSAMEAVRYLASFRTHAGHADEFVSAFVEKFK